MNILLTWRTGCARITRGMVLLGTLWTALGSAYADADDLPAPPYFVSSAEALVIGVAYDEASIKSLVPEGLSMAPGATGQVIMYTAEEAYGLPAYSSSFVAIDLAGFDAPNGAKARWMVTGLYSPAGVADALVTHFHYPVREGPTRLHHEGRKLIAVGSLGGRDMIRAEIVLAVDPCQRKSGLIHEVTQQSRSAAAQLIHVPYVADWCTAETAKVEILAPAADAFAKMQPVKVLWAGLFRGGFGWSLAANR